MSKTSYFKKEDVHRIKFFDRQGNPYNPEDDGYIIGFTPILIRTINKDNNIGYLPYGSRYIVAFDADADTEHIIKHWKHNGADLIHNQEFGNWEVVYPSVVYKGE